MTSSPASTTARNMRSTFMFRQGVAASNQNEVRLNVKTLTPEIRRRIYASGGKTKDSIKPPPPGLINFVKFRRYWVNGPLNQMKTADRLHIEDLWFWDVSSSQFDFSYADLAQNERIFTIVKGTPYSSTASGDDISVNPARDFCNTVLDSSFLLADQPLAFRMGFQKESFSEPDEKHFVKFYPPDYKIYHPNGLGPYFNVESMIQINNQLVIDSTVDISATIATTDNQCVDVSFSFADLNGDQIDLLRQGDLSLKLEIKQKDIYTNVFRSDPDVSKIIYIPNTVENERYGMFMYTPPFLIKDLSLVDASVLSSDPQEDKSRLVGPNDTGNQGLLFENAQYPDLSGVKIADSSYNINGIVLTLNHPFPTSVSRNWIESLQINNGNTGDNYKDVSNLHIVDVKPYNKVAFDLFGTTTLGFSIKADNAWVNTNMDIFKLKMNLKIPKHCARVDENENTSVFFDLDISNNVARRGGFFAASFRINNEWVKCV